MGDINLILMNLINRQRFIYSALDILRYLRDFVFCRRLHNLRHSHRYKKHFLFAKGQEKLDEELNVITLLKSIRQLKLLTQVLLNQKQKLMLRFQRQNLLETSSSSQDSDNNNQFDTMKLMESRNPMIKLVIFGRIKKMMKSYYGTKLKNLDRRLFRGLFVRSLKDFDEDYRENLQNKSLFHRLKFKMFPSIDNDDTELQWNNNSELISQTSRRQETHAGLRDSTIFNDLSVSNAYYPAQLPD